MDGVGSVVNLARKGIEPFSPQPSYNLVDNDGTWKEMPYN